MQPVVVITEPLDPLCEDWLGEHAEVVRCKVDDSSLTTELAGKVHGLIVRTYTRVDAQLLLRFPRLKVVGRGGVGLDNIDLDACRRGGVRVVYTPDANTQAVVEYVLGLILDAVRPRVDLNPGTTPDTFLQMRLKHVGRQLDQLTLGVLGFGRIGKRLGRVAHAIGMRLLVNDLLPQQELRSQVDFPFEFVDKEDLYQNSDILTLHVDGTPENRFLIDQRALSLVKPTCLLVNTSRGMVIDHEDLRRWADSVVEAGGGAVLDVHDPEPPPDDSELFHHDNIRIFPHLASRTHTALRNMSWVVRDVVAVMEGREPTYPAW